MKPVRERTEYAMLCGVIALLKILPKNLIIGFCNVIKDARYQLTSLKLK